MALMFHD